MTLSRRGMTTSRKLSVAVVFVLLIALGIYVALGASRPNAGGNGSQSSTSSSTGSVSNGEAGQPNSLLDMFGNFSRMAISMSFVVMGDGEQQDSGLSHLSYAVLGQAVVNSTHYTKVEFTDLDSNTTVIAWFNQRGLVDRADVLGDKNYTGPNAPIYAQNFVTTFSSIPSMGYNVTLLSGLNKTAESVQSIGPTQMDVVTYGLAAPNSLYNNLTIKVATLPGTKISLAVYSYFEAPDLSNNAFQVTSVTRA
jgi:hypothetical protein